MGEQTGISWTDHTFNPWWGCVKVSPGCRHCYATSLASRYGHDVWGTKKPRRFFGDKHWNEPRKWNALAEAEGRRHRVFCASMADVFEDYRGPAEVGYKMADARYRLCALIEETEYLDWQLLTKRPENAPSMVTWPWPTWPSNVWIGTSVEDQRRADERLRDLLRLPAAVRFLSVEPLLEPVTLRAAMGGRLDALSGDAKTEAGEIYAGGPAVNWVIVGGESGPRHRPFDADWARSIRDECAEAGVPFFFKQHGGRTPTAGGHLLDGREHHDFPGAGREGNV